MSTHELPVEFYNEMCARGKSVKKKTSQFAEWALEQKEYASVWPFQIIYESALEYERTPHEGAEWELQMRVGKLVRNWVLGSIPQYLDPNILTSPIPNVYVIDSNFMFSGAFLYGDSYDCERILKHAGGRWGNFSANQLDYLVIGSLGSKHWAHGSHGRTIEDILYKIRLNRSRAELISEKTWLDAIRQPLSRPEGVLSACERLESGGYDFEDTLERLWEGEVPISFVYGVADERAMLLKAVLAKPRMTSLYLYGPVPEGGVRTFSFQSINSKIKNLNTLEEYTLQEFMHHLGINIKLCKNKELLEFVSFISLKYSGE